MNCHGAPHTLGECPGCGTREEMEGAIKRLNRAMRLYELALKTECCCNSKLGAEEDDCEHCELVVKARVMVRGVKSPSKTSKPHQPRRSLQDLALRLTKAVNEAKEREVKINQHLGYADDYQLGSMSVTLRWDDVQTLLDSKSQNDEKVSHE